MEIPHGSSAFIKTQNPAQREENEEHMKHMIKEDREINIHEVILMV